MVSIAASRRFISLLTSSAMKLVMTMRGSCSTTWPSAMPSLSAAPLICTGRRAAGSGAPGRAIADSSPEAIISATTIAVVCSASSSSSE